MNLFDNISLCNYLKYMTRIMAYLLQVNYFLLYNNNIPVIIVPKEGQVIGIFID